MTGSDWLVELAIEPVPDAWDAVQTALGTVARQLDVQVSADSTARQMVLGARSEGALRGARLYLQAVVPDLCRCGAVQAACRGTPTRQSEGSFVHKRQSGGSGEFAEVILRLLPGDRGSGFRFFNDEVRGNIPAKWVPSVEKGIREAANSHDPIGLPLVDVDVHLLDGKYHDLDSSPMAFEHAGAGAMREAVAGAGVILLEPIVKAAVLAPKPWLAWVVAELEKRDAMIEEVRPSEISLVLGAARMTDLLGFEDALGAGTDGAASAAMVLHSYAEVTGNGGPDDTFPMAAALRA